MLAKTKIHFFSLHLCNSQMNFQRSQSKVWFGSQQNSVYDNFYSLPTYYNAGKKSLQSISEQHEESLSPKSECDELKRSLLIWGNRKSPSSHSHKSQVRNLQNRRGKILFNLRKLSLPGFGIFGCRTITAFGCQQEKYFKCFR